MDENLVGVAYRVAVKSIVDPGSNVNAPENFGVDMWGVDLGLIILAERNLALIDEVEDRRRSPGSNQI